VHDAVSKSAFESLKLHHGAMIERKLRLTGERLRVVLNGDFGHLKLLNDLFPCRKVERRLFW
jgi:hypothetical protein